MNYSQAIIKLKDKLYSQYQHFWKSKNLQQNNILFKETKFSISMQKRK